MKKILLTALLLCSMSLILTAQEIEVGAAQTDQYLPLLAHKRVALYSNHTGITNGIHTLDLLLKNKINVTAIFSPEHGFRGSADAGEKVSSSKDIKTGVPIYSLYNGKDGKPNTATMNQFDVLVVDIQDVGLRFYTYYINMVKLMEACADAHKEVIILDRPNPNGHYVDGPILNKKFKSGVGYLPIPIVHGMTLGELAQMVLGKKWLNSKSHCKLTVIKCKNYTHQSMYQLPISPSPNLPNMLSIYLYPSTCLFEGTPMSLGRGTTYPFQVYGHPSMKNLYSFHFTPKSIVGAKNPPLLNQKCFGVDLRNLSLKDASSQKINLNYIIDSYHSLNIGRHFFKPFFNLLMGVSYVQDMIVKGKTAAEISKMWENDVETFKKQRKPYLLYPDQD